MAKQISEVKTKSGASSSCGNKSTMPSKVFNLKTAKSLDCPQAFHIPQHYVGYTDATMPKNTMVATNLGPNLGLGIYNPQNGKAALAHIDIFTGFGSIVRIFGKMRQDNNEELKLFISGGNPISASHFIKLLATLEKIPNLEIVVNDSFPVNAKNSFSLSLGIDASGKFYISQEELWYHAVHPYKSPQIENINYFSQVGGTYSIIEIDYSSPAYDPITVLGDYHPSYYQ